MKIAILALALTGCAVATTGVVPQGDGYMTITRQGASFATQTAELTALVKQEAGAHCDSRKKSLKIVHVKEIPAGPLGRWPESELVFQCF